MSRREGEGRPVPDPPARDDATATLPPDPKRPGVPPAAGTWGGEGGAGEPRGRPSQSDDGGSEVM
jgi:hypothetical protein